MTWRQKFNQRSPPTLNMNYRTLVLSSYIFQKNRAMVSHRYTSDEGDLLSSCSKDEKEEHSDPNMTQKLRTRIPAHKPSSSALSLQSPK